jgi:hypothetical protein
MGVSGQRPKPAAIRALHNSKPRPHHREEPTIPDAPAAGPQIPAPAGLIKAERAYWDYFAPLLASAKILTPADVETLKDYVRACLAVDNCARRLRTAYRRREPDLAFVRLQDASMRGWVERKTKLAGELGLTAIARTRVVWTGCPQAPGATPAAPGKSSVVVELQAQGAELRRPLAELQARAAQLRRPLGVATATARRGRAARSAGGSRVTTGASGAQSRRPDRTRGSGAAGTTAGTDRSGPAVGDQDDSAPPPPSAGA